jgi:hypothetical protein
VTFNLSLTAYDAQVIDLGELFNAGTLPFPGFGASCAALSAGLSKEDLEGLQDAHMGQSSTLFSGRCGATERNDRKARGFLTIDVVDDCTDETPADPGYFVDGGGGMATNQNALWGEYTLSDDARGFAQGEPMVHIEATGVVFFGIGVTPTFYAKLIGSVADDREALPVSWGSRYFNGLTDLICWHDNFLGTPFVCGDPDFSPPQLETIVFDHQENAEVLDSRASPCPAQSSRTQVGGPLLPVTPKTGWISVSGNVRGAPVGVRGLIVPPARLFVTAVHTLHPGGLSVEVGGVAIDDELLPMGKASRLGSPLP